MFTSGLMSCWRSVEGHGRRLEELASVVAICLSSWANPGDSKDLTFDQRAARSRPALATDEPEDITGAILCLTSGDAAFMTGQEIVVDGGQYRIGGARDRAVVPKEDCLLQLRSLAQPESSALGCSRAIRRCKGGESREQRTARRPGGRTRFASGKHFQDYAACSISFISASESARWPAFMFSSRCATEEVPGIGSITGLR
jgi:hypothetical protein